MDWLRKLFSEPGTLIAVASGAVVGLVVGIANGIIQRKHGGWIGFFSAILWGVIVSVLVGLLIQDYIPSEPLRLALVGMCAVISDDIVTGLKTFGQGLRNDPLGAVARLINALRGQSNRE